MKKLQILIPQYEETDDVIKPMLDSLAIQQGVNLNDLGVIICNDGSNVFLTQTFLDSYPFEIEYHKEPHKGVSGTRNACLDYATADYVMFCDADDMFYNACGLWIIFREINKEPFDTMVSIFVEETHNPETGENFYISHEMDSTFVHGKIHRRQYLIDNNIRWNENLTIHEDSYFNIQCHNFTKEMKYCQTPFYLWKWRAASVCRHDPKYILKTYKNMIASNCALVEVFLQRSMIDKARFYTGLMIFDAYYAMNKPEWIDQENQEYRNSTEKYFAKYFQSHKGLWDSISDSEKMQISNGVRNRNVMEGMQMEKATMAQWLDYISTLGQTQ